MIQKALFGAGCFWGVEEHFRKINGIIKTEVGYSGGKTKDPTYESVCYENTNHAEVLQVEFDENIISYSNLLEEFWKCHDPTTLDKQGLDIGRQYRSVIYYFDDYQKIQQPCFYLHCFCLLFFEFHHQYFYHQQKLLIGESTHL